MSRTRWIALGVALLALAVYANALVNGFAFDDVPIILDNGRVHGLDRVAEIFGNAYWPTEVERRGLYRPITLLTFAVDWELWNGNAFGFHLVNLVLHAGVTVLVFLVLRSLSVATAAAGVGAALFAVHPVHVEAVSNLVGRGELLTAAFFLLGVWAYLRGRGGWRTAGLVSAAYLLGLLSKEMAVTLPAVLLLLDVRGRNVVAGAAETLRRKWRVYAALVATLAGYMLLRFAVIGAFVGGGREPLWFWDEPWTASLYTAIRLWPEYMRLMLFPAELIAEYGPAVIIPETGVSYLVVTGFLVGVGALAVAWVTWRPAPLIGVGIAWFAVTVLPVTGLLFSVEIMLAERTLYLPSVGIALCAAELARLVWEERPEWVRPAAAALIILLTAGAVRTWTRTPVWEDTNTVINDLAANHPESYRVQWAMAIEEAKKENYEEMVHRYQIAIRMAPRSYALRGDFARDLYRRGHFAAAAAHFDTMSMILPEHPHPPVLRLLSLIDGEYLRRAVEEGRALTRTYPGNSGVRHQLARALARTGAWEAAEGQRLKAIALERPFVQPEQWGHLAGLHVLQGDTAAAAAALDSARARQAADAPAPDSVGIDAGSPALAADSARSIPTLDQMARALADGDTAVIPYW